MARHFLLGCCGLLIFSLPALAQPRGPAKGGDEVRQLKEELSKLQDQVRRLTESQKAPPAAKDGKGGFGGFGGFGPGKDGKGGFGGFGPMRRPEPPKAEERRPEPPKKEEARRPGPPQGKGPPGMRRPEPPKTEARRPEPPKKEEARRPAPPQSKGPPWMRRPEPPKTEARRPEPPASSRRPSASRGGMPGWGRSPWSFPRPYSQWGNRPGESASREDLDRRLDRLTRELEELRREMRTPARR